MTNFYVIVILGVLGLLVGLFLPLATLPAAPGWRAQE
jgi:hypothetical protein